MKRRMVGLMLGLLSLTACQRASVAPLNALPVPGNPLAAMTAESCHQTLETYMKAIQANPEKYREENLAAYPEMVQYGKTLGACQQKGFLTPQDMMRVATKVDADAAGTISDPEKDTAGDSGNAEQ